MSYYVFMYFIHIMYYYILFILCISFMLCTLFHMLNIPIAMYNYKSYMYKYHRGVIFSYPGVTRTHILPYHSPYLCMSTLKALLLSINTNYSYNTTSYYLHGFYPTNCCLLNEVQCNIFSASYRTLKHTPK